jgi:Transposase IS4
MTTFHSAIATTTVTRHHFPSETVTAAIPTAVEDYNTHRCGVDRVDQMETYYRLGRRTKRWWLRLAWWLLDVVLNNSWRLYQLKMNSNMKSVEFRTKLMLQLSEDKPMPTTQKTRKRQRTTVDNSSLAHLPVQQQERGRCSVCCSNNKDHRGYMKCVTCNVYLCANRNCFMQYHS